MDDDQKKCPFCAEYVKKDAVVCRYCKRELPQTSEEKVSCRKCSAIILESTANETNGLCMPCSKKDYKEIESKLYLSLIICAIIGGSVGYIFFKNTFSIIIGAFIGAVSSSFVFDLFANPETKEKHSEYGKKVLAEKQRRAMSTPIISCPTCKSNNVNKISAGKKMAYVAATGILAPAFKKVRSQFECKSCGYKW